MLKENGKNAVKKGEVIFAKGEAVTQIGIILSGKVLLQGEAFRLIKPQGSCIAISAINSETYSSEYKAIEDSVIYALPVHGEETVRRIIAKNADYRAIMISSQFKSAVDLHRIKMSLVDRSERIFNFAKKSYDEYKSFCKDYGVAALGLAEIDDLQPYEMLQDMNEYRIAYYEEGAKIPLGAIKQYFSYSEDMAGFQINEIMGLVSSMRDDCAAMVEYIKGILDIVGLRPRQNLFEYICAKANEVKAKENLPVEVHVLLSNIINELEFQYDALRQQLADMPKLDSASLKDKMSALAGREVIAKEQKSKEERGKEIARDLESLQNSLGQILGYAPISYEDRDTLRENINRLVNAPDRLSVEDDVKKAKKTITPLIFKLYLACYRKIREGIDAPPKAVELFMNYGYIDERLLDTEHLEFLCGIEYEENEGPCNVVSMMEWLDMIKEGKREASKSEFDEDYVENLRSLKKQGEITEKEQKELLANMDKRVEYEVMNMQMSNSRTVYGQPSSYMPILYKEAIFGYLDNILVTKRKINESVKRLVEIDYSVFYREVIYSNTSLKIVNETVMKNVYPDVILFPLFGISASMWQEVGGKNKGTPARFCFPVMTSTSIDELMVKMFGRFRWEICRCIQGMAWNDVKVKSLTSEYMDYIQFYRKNRDLSDEAREKVKLQIQKGRNNSREIFLMDYEAWIKNESNGSMKMNKVARELVATYCPFEKSLRNKLNSQRPYEVAQARSIRNAQKKKQEFELKIKALQKVTEDIPDEMMDTYKFYAEM